jgi:predicted patatin/cPLA2 family phospholipase
MKKATSKKVIKHLKSDVETFKHEAKEDKELMKSIKDAAKHKEKKEKKHKKSPKGDVAKSKVQKVMHEYKEGKLRSGSKKGPKVTNPKQAIAIALSEARKRKK